MKVIKTPKKETSANGFSERAGSETRVLAVPNYFSQKQFLMRPIGALLLVLFSPLILVCAALVKLSSPGPAFLRQKRVGRNEEPFEILKLRTMYSNAEDMTGPTFCQPRDSRITPVGRVLRFLHLDELPQLVNVARGEMCLVGPRPERPEIIAKFQLNEKVPGYLDRTKVLPGVTGLAQINLPADLTVDCVKPKVKMDQHYIESAKLGLDFRILVCTALRMCGIRHGHAVHLLKLARNFDCEVNANNEPSSADSDPQVRLSHPRDKRVLVPLLIGASENSESGIFSHSEELASEGHDEDFAIGNGQDSQNESRPRQPR